VVLLSSRRRSDKPFQQKVVAAASPELRVLRKIPIGHRPVAPTLAFIPAFSCIEEKTLRLDAKVFHRLFFRMRQSFSKLPLQLGPGFVGIMLILSLTGCGKKSGQAVVLEKESIAAREATPSPAVERSPKPTESTSSPSSADSEVSNNRPLAEDEIVVGLCVMKKDARGTSRDPRAISDEQWLVSVEMVSDLRRFDIHTNKTHWERVKVGDRINVSYRQGKYTGTVWSAEIE
jgi:hypothetical protein